MRHTPFAPLDRIWIRLLALPALGIMISVSARDSTPVIREKEKAPLGEKFIGLSRLRWPQTSAGPFRFNDSKFTLVRWWTDHCPFCEKSLPALSSLANEYPEIRLMGVYHPKPSRAVSDKEVMHAARRYGLDGRIAIDEDWSVLKMNWLDGADREATSVTFVVDARGVVRYIHPGPLICRPVDEKNQQANRDFKQLREFLIEQLSRQEKVK